MFSLGSFPTWIVGNSDGGCNGFDSGGSTLCLTNQNFWINRNDGTVETQACFHSRHAGGAQFALADGSTRFISENIDRILVWEPTGGRNDGRVFTMPSSLSLRHPFIPFTSTVELRESSGGASRWASGRRFLFSLLQGRDHMSGHRTSHVSSLGRASAVLVALSMWAAGCGSAGEHTTAPVTGKVTHDGQPVTGGTITFVPVAASGEEMPGKPASGPVQSDGTYTLTTYEPGDGAVVGKHTVSYSAPVPETPEMPEGGHVQQPPESPYARMTPQQAEVEVPSGGATINIELVPGAVSGPSGGYNPVGPSGGHG